MHEKKCLRFLSEPISHITIRRTGAVEKGRADIWSMMTRGTHGCNTTCVHTHWLIAHSRRSPSCCTSSCLCVPVSSFKPSEKRVLLVSARKLSAVVVVFFSFWQTFTCCCLSSGEHVKMLCNTHSRSSAGLASPPPFVSAPPSSFCVKNKETAPATCSRTTLAVSPPLLLISTASSLLKTRQPTQCLFLYGWVINPKEYGSVHLQEKKV